MAIDYPAFLPTPQRSTVSPAEGRQLFEQNLPRFARAISTENRQFESLQWPAMSSADHEALMDWWKNTLIYGGAWFNATWPLPRGRIAAVRRMMRPPKREYAGKGMWRTTAVCEVRGLSQPAQEGTPDAGTPVIGWFSPVTDGGSGIPAHANSGTGDLSDYSGVPTNRIYAGVVGYVAQTVTWSIVSWTSGSGDASPYFSFTTDAYVEVQWQNLDGSGSPIITPSIGTLIITAVVDGVPISVGQRLVAASAPPTSGDYATIAWGPE